MELNAAHVHLVLNHAPIFGFAFGLLVLAWGRWRKSDEMIRAGLALFFLAGVIAVPVFFSGEGAEDVVEGLAGVSGEALEAHEAAGKLAMVVALVVGLLSGVGLYRYLKSPVPGKLATWAAVGGVVALGFLVYAGFQGGQVHHQELRSGTSSALSGEAQRLASRNPLSLRAPDLGLRGSGRSGPRPGSG